MADELLLQLENAAKSMVNPAAVNQKERIDAENVFLSFRKTRMPYALCKEILEKSSNDYVLFQIATAVKEAVLRDWSILNSQDIESLRSFLLNYVIKQHGLKFFVREQILQAIAVIFKRGTLDQDETLSSRVSLFNDISQMIHSNVISMQLVGCSILTALLNEYSNSDVTSRIGLTWEFHYKSKNNFEKKDLKHVFVFCLQILCEIEKMSTPFHRDVLCVTSRVLALTAQIFSWNFLPHDLPRKLIGNFMTSQSSSFKPLPSWKDVIIDNSLPEIMYNIHLKVRYNSEMAHNSLLCLSQLASINGVVFRDDDQKIAFLSCFISAHLKFIFQIQLQDFESIGISDVVYSLILFCTPSILSKIHNVLLDDFLSALSEMTCAFGEKAVIEIAQHRDELTYMDSYEKLLDAWSILLIAENEFKPELLEIHCQSILNSYLKCHLAAPEGIRNIHNLQEDEEIDEIEDDDCVRFHDQLCCLGIVSRKILHYSISLINKLLNERINEFHIYLHNASMNCSAEEKKTVLNDLHEDMHWLLLIIAYIYTHESEGETPTIPTSIMKHSILQRDAVDVRMTLQMLISSTTAMKMDSNYDNVDVNVRIFSEVFRLCEIEKQAANFNMLPILSPQVSKSLMWLINRWVQAYLFPNENYYSEVSDVLMSIFGKNTEGSRLIVEFLINKVVSNLSVWNSEVSVLLDTSHVLISLVDKKEFANEVIKCESFWSVIRSISANIHPIDGISPDIKKELYKAVVYAGSSKLENMNKNDYWQLVLQPLHDRFNNIAQLENLPINIDPKVNEEILTLLEALSGIAVATRIDTVDQVYEFLHPLLVQCVPLLDYLHNYAEFVEAILDIFNMVASHQLCYLSQKHSNSFYELSMQVIQVYFRHNIGSTCLSKCSEDEKYNNLLTLLLLVSNILSKDLVDFGLTSDNMENEIKIDAVDVSIYGLNMVIPLLQDNLLQFPALCTAYYRLLTYIADVHASKVFDISNDLLNILFNSLEYGFTKFGTDITKLCLEFIQSVSTHFLNSDVKPCHIGEALCHFLKVVMELLLQECYDMDLLDITSATLFSLICCNFDQYQMIITNLLSKYKDSPYHERLFLAFSDLTPTVCAPKFNRSNRIEFMKKFGEFIINVRGFLIIR